MIGWLIDGRSNRKVLFWVGWTVAVGLAEWYVVLMPGRIVLAGRILG